MKKSRFTVYYSFLFADEWFQNLLEYVFSLTEIQCNLMNKKVHFVKKYLYAWNIFDRLFVKNIPFQLFCIYCSKSFTAKRLNDASAVYSWKVYTEHFVFLSTSLVRWTWPKLYTTTGKEWENRINMVFDW